MKMFSVSCNKCGMGPCVRHGETSDDAKKALQKICFEDLDETWIRISEKDSLAIDIAKTLAQFSGRYDNSNNILIAIKLLECYDIKIKSDLGDITCEGESMMPCQKGTMSKLDRPVSFICEMAGVLSLLRAFECYGKGNFLECVVFVFLMAAFKRVLALDSSRAL